MASEVLLTISRDEHERARLLSEFKGQKDYESKMVYAKRAGRAEGLAEGRAERDLEIARKMKNAGKPLSEIMEFTGLPTETIEQL